MADLNVTIHPSRGLSVFGLLVNPWWTTGVTQTALSASNTDVQDAIDAASTGDRVLVPSGSGTWTSVSIPSGKKIQLQGAGSGSTLITGGLQTNASGSRVTGFQLTDSVYVDGSGWRVDHCVFACTILTEGVFANGGTPTAPYGPTGVVDHCTFQNALVLSVAYAGTGSGLVGYQWSSPLGLGDANAVYIEDNTFIFTVFGNCVDANYGGRYVFRYNDVTDVYLEAHSNQGVSRASRRWEIYENAIHQVSRGMNFWTFLRGGTGVVYNNTIDGTWTGSGNVQIDNDRCFNDRGTVGQCDGSDFYPSWDGNDPVVGNGWPCRDQIGRGVDLANWNYGDTPQAQVVDPAYMWGNYYNEVLAGVVVANSCGAWISDTRDYYVNAGAKPGYTPYAYPHPLALVT